MGAKALTPLALLQLLSMNTESFQTTFIHTELDAALYILFGILLAPALVELVLRFTQDVKNANRLRKLNAFVLTPPLSVVMFAVAHRIISRPELHDSVIRGVGWFWVVMAIIGLVAWVLIMLGYYLSPPATRRIMDYQRYGGKPPHSHHTEGIYDQ